MEKRGTADPLGLAVLFISDRGSIPLSFLKQQLTFVA